jgi:uncharacterized protein YndB with AHSA1/START domain
VIADDRVTVSSHVAVDPSAAFDLFTRDVDAWWQRGPRYRHGGHRKGELRFEPGVGGRFVEVYDEGENDLFEIGRVLVWEPAARLVFEWRANDFQPGQLTEVEIRFEPSGDGTRITLEHRGWAALPAGHPARHGLAGPAFTQMIGLWWADVLNAARAHASRDGRDGSRPPTRAAP